MSRDSRCSCCRLRTEGGVEGDEQEMFRLQDRMALIPLVRNKTLTRERMTLGVGAIFWFISHTLAQYHALQRVGDTYL
jgi:hypothetical protein